ncbi:hypothetical protein [uncultured phage_Deep-GF0-KM16-C193]|uniref:Uncharacterized protein n=1 Tax=uncultured phage_Deep-GF0-KM16-C193 TaxID=2740799 RepID=A0A1B1IWR8_9CAUD|nr:hypothetical protein HOU06_gp32 [uncultured phage_Deep-GF0-KM16-C193]ANS05766.1 hypothetical protein [uncultured phage_Deep-GF0-KM16-C193]
MSNQRMVSRYMEKTHGLSDNLVKAILKKQGKEINQTNVNDEIKKRLIEKNLFRYSKVPKHLRSMH